jgi:hypothetical protein
MRLHKLLSLSYRMFSAFSRSQIKRNSSLRLPPSTWALPVKCLPVCASKPDRPPCKHTGVSAPPQYRLLPYMYRVRSRARARGTCTGPDRRRTGGGPRRRSPTTRRPGAPAAAPPSRSCTPAPPPPPHSAHRLTGKWRDGWLSGSPVHAIGQLVGLRIPQSRLSAWS